MPHAGVRPRKIIISMNQNTFFTVTSYLADKTHIEQSIVRFVIIGAVNTAFAYGLYALFIFLGMYDYVAVFCSTLIGIFFSFKTFGAFVFENTNNRRIFRFFAVYILGYFLNVLILRLFCFYVWNNLYIAGLVSSLCVALFSFVANKRWVYKK